WPRSLASLGMTVSSLGMTVSSLGMTVSSLGMTVRCRIVAHIGEGPMDTGTLETPAAPAQKALRTYDELPGPRGVPVLGNLLQIEPTRMHQQLESWCAEYGEIYRLRLGKRRAVVVARHELVSTILRDRPDGFRRTAKLEQVWGEMGLLNGVFAANGET